MSLDDVREWARRCQTGDPDEIRESLSEAYMAAKPFIVYVSMQAAKPGLDREEMIAAGTEGFVTSLMRFDYGSDAAKLGFIGSYIRNFVLKECSLHAAPMTASYSSYSRDNRIKALRNAIEMTGITPTPKLISEASTNPKFSRAGYGRKRQDGTDRQPVKITENQVKEFLSRETRVFSDIDGVDAASPEDRGRYSELVELAREIAFRKCSNPELVMETFEKGRIPNPELRKEKVKRSELDNDIEILLTELRGQLSEEDFS